MTLHFYANIIVLVMSYVEFSNGLCILIDVYPYIKSSKFYPHLNLISYCFIFEVSDLHILQL